MTTLFELITEGSVVETGARLAVWTSSAAGSSAPS